MQLYKFFPLTCGHERAQILIVEVFPAPAVFFVCVASAKWVCKEEEEEEEAASNEN